MIGTTNNQIGRGLSTIPSSESENGEAISWDKEGEVLCRIGDPIWTFTGPREGGFVHLVWRKEAVVDDEILFESNLRMAKELLLLRIRHGKPMSSSTVRLCGIALRMLASFCTNERLEISKLAHYPQVVQTFARTTSYSYVTQIISLARLAWAKDDVLSWNWLNPSQIKFFQNARRLAEGHQTPVVPRRISNYAHETADTTLNVCLELLPEFVSATREWLSGLAGPRSLTIGLWPRILKSHPKLKHEFDRLNIKSGSMRIIYIRRVREAALLKIAYGTMARRDEILSLKRGCWSEDEIDGKTIHFIRSKTTKTQENDNALWVASKSVKIAVDVLEGILDWYYLLHKSPPVKTEYLFQVLDGNLGRYLSPSQEREAQKLLHGQPMDTINFEQLLVGSELVVSEEEIAHAKMLTPSLDPQKFTSGESWRITPHQFRRTGLVYAAASGLVSQDALAFQAKHKTLQMTAYYSRNYWLLRKKQPDHPLVAATDEALANEFVEEHAESYNLDIAAIGSEKRFFCEYGGEHKQRLVDGIPLLTLSEIKLGEANKVLKRNTLGICAQEEYCEYQSALTVRGCMTKSNGGMCVKAIVDDTRVPELTAFVDGLLYRQGELRPQDGFEREQIEADLDITRRAIGVMLQHGAKENE